MRPSSFPAPIDLRAFEAALAEEVTVSTSGSAQRKPARQTSLLARAFIATVARSATVRRRTYRLFYDRLARRSSDVDSWTTMNYGYASLEECEGHTIDLDPLDEEERYCLQLHDRVARDVDLDGRVLVEVSSGRGGGASFLHRSRHPTCTIGVDIAPAAVRFCRSRHRIPGLTFEEGDAENLPLTDESADAVVNIEASFCYGSLGGFFAEVRRVLRPDGWFLFADLRLRHELPEFFSALEYSGLEVVEAEDITENVVRALELDHARRADLIAENSPRLLRGAFGTFAGLMGSRMPVKLAQRSMVYLRIAARKPSGPESERKDGR